MSAIPYKALRNKNVNTFKRRRSLKMRFFGPGTRLVQKIHNEVIQRLANKESGFSLSSFNRAKSVGFSEGEDWLQLLTDAIIAALSLTGGPWAPLIAIAVKLIIQIVIQSLNEVSNETAFRANPDKFDAQLQVWARESRYE